MKRLVNLLIVTIFFSGCSILGHMDELLTLKAVGDEQAAMDREVGQQKKKFALLVEATKKDSFLKDYSTKDKIRRRFGDPVFTRPETKDGQELELWLYRHGTKFSEGDKVYLYFNPTANLMSWEYVEAPKKEAESK